MQSGATRHEGGSKGPDAGTRRIGFCEKMIPTILSHRFEIPPDGMAGGEQRSLRP